MPIKRNKKGFSLSFKKRQRRSRISGILASYSNLNSETPILNLTNRDEFMQSDLDHDQHHQILPEIPSSSAEIVEASSHLRSLDGFDNASKIGEGEDTEIFQQQSISQLTSKDVPFCSKLAS